MFLHAAKRPLGEEVGDQTRLAEQHRVGELRAAHLLHAIQRTRPVDLNCVDHVRRRSSAPRENASTSTQYIYGNSIYIYVPLSVNNKRQVNRLLEFPYLEHRLEAAQIRPVSESRQARLRHPQQVRVAGNHRQPLRHERRSARAHRTRVAAAHSTAMRASICTRSCSADDRSQVAAGEQEVEHQLQLRLPTVRLREQHYRVDRPERRTRRALDSRVGDEPLALRRVAQVECGELSADVLGGAHGTEAEPSRDLQNVILTRSVDVLRVQLAHQREWSVRHYHLPWSDLQRKVHAKYCCGEHPKTRRSMI